MRIPGESPLELMLQVSRQAIAFRQRLGKLDEGLTRIVLGWLADDYLQARDQDTPASQRLRAALHLACHVRLMGERDSKLGTILLALSHTQQAPGPLAFLEELQKAVQSVEGKDCPSKSRRLPKVPTEGGLVRIQSSRRRTLPRSADAGNTLDALVTFETAVRLLETFSPRERDVFLRVVEGTPPAAAAVAAAPSPAASRKLLSRLRKKIRRQL